MAGGKSESVRVWKEAMLAAGKTVVVASSRSVTKWYRLGVRGRGRWVDVAEDLKPMPGHRIGEVWVNEADKFDK